jgi:hypothetical protein
MQLLALKDDIVLLREWLWDIVWIITNSSLPSIQIFF